jgi:hypothetical protein
MLILTCTEHWTREWMDFARRRSFDMMLCEPCDGFSMIVQTRTRLAARLKNS